MLVSYGVTISVIVLFWLNSRRLPRTKKGKVGFIVSVSIPSEEEKVKIKEDFIDSLREQIKGGPTGGSFQFIEIPQYLAPKIVDLEEAKKIRIKCKAHFILFGRVRLRDIDGKKHHIINLDGEVTHNPIPGTLSEKLSKEFTELLPRRLRIAEENDLLSFEFTSGWIDCVAKYIIGIASLLSLDPDYAERLFKEVQERFKTLDPSFPIYNKLRQRLPLRMTEIHISRAGKAHYLWRETREENYINEMGHHLNKIEKKFSRLYKVCLLKSIFFFINGRQIALAKAELKKCRKEQDATWHYNLAFLMAYEGYLVGTIKEYDKGNRTQYLDPSVIAQIEEFICLVLEEEPEKYQLYFCLGYINWKTKGDIKQAIHDFTKFLEAGSPGEFTQERQKVNRWLEHLKRLN